MVAIQPGVLADLDQGASVELWVRFPQDVASRSYLMEWLEATAAPFAGMSLAVENGKLRIYLGSWVDLAPVQPSRWSRIVVTKQPAANTLELTETTQARIDDIIAMVLTELDRLNVSYEPKPEGNRSDVPRHSL